MTDDRAAIKIALDLLRLPSQLHCQQSAPLPEGVDVLLAIAADDAAAVSDAVFVSGEPADVVRRAACFYIEQVILSTNSDSYRTLAATPESTDSELRRNMALLIRWLHPDLCPGRERATFVRRVTKAWADLKSPQRRMAFETGFKGASRADSERELAGESTVNGMSPSAPDEPGSRFHHYQIHKIAGLGRLRRTLRRMANGRREKL